MATGKGLSQGTNQLFRFHRERAARGTATGKGPNYIIALRARNGSHLVLSCANFSLLTGSRLCTHGFTNWAVIEFRSGIRSSCFAPCEKAPPHDGAPNKSQPTHVRASCLLSPALSPRRAPAQAPAAEEAKIILKGQGGETRASRPPGVRKTSRFCAGSEIRLGAQWAPTSLLGSGLRDGSRIGDRSALLALRRIEC